MTSLPPNTPPQHFSPSVREKATGEAGAEHGGRGGEIWIVSSHASLEEELMHCLVALPFPTVSFTTGETCLRQLKQLADTMMTSNGDRQSYKFISVLLIANQLSDTDGISLIGDLRNQHPNFTAPIIILSSKNETNRTGADAVSVRTVAFQAGVSDCIELPLVPQELETKVRNLIRLQSLSSNDPTLTPTLKENESSNESSNKSSSDKLKALRVENQYLKTILDNLPQQVFWKDENLRFLGCNRPWAEAVKIKDTASIIGKTDFDLYPDTALAKQFQDKDQYVLTTGVTLEETMAKAKVDDDGTRRWLDVTRQPIVDDNQNQIGVMGVIDDITQKHLAEEQRRFAEAKYREIFENAVEGLFQLSVDGHFLSVNPALARLYGYSSPEVMMAEVTDLDVQIYAQPKRRQEILAYLQQFSELTDFESLVKHRDGRKFWVSENIRQVQNDAGDVLYLEGSVKDITEKRHTEMNLRKQRQQSERLLLNILPQMIAQRLKTSPGLVADNFKEATVLFADIVGFTEWASQIDVSELVKVLNTIFSEFDLLAEKLEVEKIKTIGDAYMAVSGVPIPVENHAKKMAEMALQMQGVIGQFYRRSRNGREPFRLRIGMHSGAVSAGVVGLRKFFYDLWGDTVNVASRMESQGTPGRIQVTHETYLLLKDSFELERRGEFKIKGKGNMQTYWLLGRKTQQDE